MAIHKVRHSLGRIPVAFEVLNIEALSGTTITEPPVVYCTAADRALWTVEHIFVRVNMPCVYTLEVW